MPSLYFLLLFFLQQLLPFSSGCNKRTIVLRGPKLYRNKCVGCNDAQADQGDEGSLPPGLPPTTGILLTTSTKVGVTETQTVGPVIPIGDCKCGMGISRDMVKSGEGDTKQLSRPWMVHFRIRLENKEYIECSGSLINRRWIISAAHCFCPLNEHIECAQVNRGFNKELKGKDKIYNLDLNTRINVTFGSTDAAFKESKKLESYIEKIVIHPDYWEDKTKHGNSYDLALIKMNMDIYSGDGFEENGTMLIHPICLPPFGPVDWDMTKPNFTEEYLAQNTTRGKYPWIRKDSPRIPFEDMDCDVSFKPEINVPNPTNAQAGWLKCHPDKFAHDPYKNINIMGKNSFITAFGSIAHPLTLNGLAPFGGKRVCRSNEFSPENNIFKKCRYNRCLRDVDNPSLNNSMCKRFQEKSMTDLGADTTVAVLKIPSGPDGTVYCYPWDSKTVQDVTSFSHKPYSGGWCDTCDPYDQKEKDCRVTPENNWGWCVPGCDGSQDQNWEESFRRNIHELPVDAFVYENCSVNVDTLTEFCTGSAITQGKMSVYRFDNTSQDLNTSPFSLIRTAARTFHTGDIGWNGNGTIIRSGARYQGRQHSSYQGDSCFGDAGGAVWKFSVFRDSVSESKEWGGEKLAVLTGVISRFEEMCGAFSPWPSEEFGDEPNLPTQHTVHARVQTHLEWIVSNVFTEGSCLDESGS